MDLSIDYLGLELKSPLMLGASPVADDLDAVRRAEDDGAAAIVLHSLFEEQITGDRSFAERHLGGPDTTAREALYFVPERTEFALGAEAYLEQIRRIKAAVSVPVFGSLNGTAPGRWLECARLIDQAGADGLELNVYRVETDHARDPESVEAEAVEMVRVVRAHTRLPLAVKLTPFHTSLGHFTAQLIRAGATGMVLFNRIYQPDIDLDTLEVRPALELSSPSELPLRLRWLAILSASFDVSFAASGGIHSGVDALKAVAAGARGVQLVSEVLKHGTHRFREIERSMREWLEARDFVSLAQLRGSLDLSRCQSPAEYQRVNYLRALHSWPVKKADDRRALPG